MRTIISSWQTPCVLLLLFGLGLLGTEAHYLAVDGIVFVCAMYAFTGGTSVSLTPSKTLGRIAAASVVVLAYLVASDKSPELGYFDSIPFAIFFTVAYFTAAGTRRSAFRAIKMMVVATGGVAIWAIHKGALPHDYVKGMFDDSNLFAALMFAALLPSVGFAAQAWKEGSKRNAAAWAAISCVTAVAAIEAHSRGAWVAVFISLSVGLFLFRTSLRITKVRAAVIAAVVLLLAVPGIMSKTESDLSQHNGAGASFKTRHALLSSTIQMIEDHPLAGTGWGTWSAVYPRYRTSQDLESAGYRAHCDYLEAWSSGGVAGLAVILAIPLILLLALRKLPGKAGGDVCAIAGIFAGASVLVVQASVNFIFHQNGVVALAGALVGALYAISRVEEEPTIRGGMLAWRVIGILSLIATAYLATVSYFSGVPVDIMRNPRGTEGLLFGQFMNKDDLTVLSRLNPLSPIPDFAIGHLFTIAGALEKKNPAHRAELFDEAIAYYEKSDKRAPFDPAVPYRKALIYGVYPGLDTATRYRLTIAALDAALARNPRYPAALSAYVITVGQEGHFDLARQRLHEALMRAPALDQAQIEKLLHSVDVAQEKSSNTAKQ